MPLPQQNVRPVATSLPLPPHPAAAMTFNPVGNIKPPAEPKPNLISYDDPAVKPKEAAASDGSAASGKPGVPHIAFATSKVTGVMAGLTGDQTLMLMPGLMPCVLDTAIDSTLPGPVMCHLPGDVRPHGVTLLDRGSQVYGYYKSDVQNGQSRLAVAADWINDPTTGCFVQFDNAPMADQQGRSGLDGHVDNHTFERFGAAVTLSLIDAGLGILQSAVSKGGNTYLSFNSGGELSSVASQILRKQIDIPPTISKNAGELIAVFVNKPLNFSGCYELKDAR
jgi:type IV secretion system protein VirB10